MTTSQIALAADDPRVNRALFTLCESTAYLDVPVSTLHLWARPVGGKPLLTIFPRSGRAATMPLSAISRS